MMKPSVILIVALLAYPAWQCTNATSVESPNDSLEGFPIAVGSVWIYGIFDSIAHQADTVEVRVSERFVSTPSRSVYLWRYTYRTHTDSLYLVRAGDTVLFYRSRQSDFASIMFVFPLEVGRGWYRPSADTFSVEAKENIATPAGNFANSFRVFERPFIGNFYGGTTYWLSSEVGIVQKHEQWFDTITMERRNTTWQLLSYSFPR